MKISIFFCFLFVLLLPSVISAHSGNTDSYGGHNKTENGTYHCHSGQCLEDAKKDAYDNFFPLGQKDGKIGIDHAEDITAFLYDNLDIDVAVYTIPDALEAYKMGYEDTYVPTFWEKYKWYIIGLSGLTVFGVINFKIRKKKNNVAG